MDITSDFRKLARQETTKRQAQLPKKERDTGRLDILPPKRANFSQPANNAFLTEAYIIAKHLRALRERIVGIRPAYLNLQSRQQTRRPATDFHGLGRQSAVKLSDPERDEIDRGIKQAVRQMMGKIQSLTQLGEATLDAITDNNDQGIEGAKILIRRLVGALDPRKAGKLPGDTTELASQPGLPLELSRRDVVAAHQSSVIWYLNSLLQKTNKVHAEMQELYLRQKLERQRGVLSQQQPKQMLSKGAATVSEKQGSEQDEMLSHLSQQELKMLQTENHNMVQEFESALDQIRDTQRSVLEISTLQSQLATELNAQMQQTERLYNEAVGALDDVGQGNDYLISARKHQSTARKWVLTIFIVLSLVLLFLDWFD
ncbi:hypothetical protein LPJ66_004359 [Kickxella alabastrina]|uniref:Uncharacterized protein n=1 Tax=Kickxella alabastrina TaxID=61397 RepID=A0ACC1II66_9FUNG|nr:hypothetical protein LPJ66_004359 [Kickxella alabastrina]